MHWFKSRTNVFFQYLFSLLFYCSTKQRTTEFSTLFNGILIKHLRVTKIHEETYSYALLSLRRIAFPYTAATTTATRFQEGKHYCPNTQQQRTFYEKYCGLKLLLNSTSALFQLLKLKIRAMPYACLESCTNSKQKQVKRMLLPPSTHP